MPPPNEPILEQIRSNIITTLRSVTPGVSYWNELSNSVLEGALNDIEALNISPLVTVSVQGARYQNGPNFLYTIFQNFLITLYTADDDPAIKSRNSIRLLSDVITALTDDERRGGLAWDTKMISHELVDIDPAFPLIITEVIFQVEYRTSVKDPHSNNGTP